MKIDSLITLVDTELAMEVHYAFLPVIRELLTAIQSVSEQPGLRKRYASGLGRIVLEDIKFAESIVGQRLLELLNKELSQVE